MFGSSNSFQKILKRPRRSIRRGFTSIELMVSAILLMTVISFFTMICVRIDGVWKDINHQRIAVCELANQLEDLTRMTRRQAEAAVGSLQPSSICNGSLPQPELSGELMEDEFGIRIALQIDWKRRHPGRPVELVGWIISGPAEVDP